MKTLRQAAQTYRSPGGRVLRWPDNTSSTGQHLVYRTTIVYWTTSPLPDNNCVLDNISSTGQRLDYRKRSRLVDSILYVGNYFFCFWLLTSKTANIFILYVQKECFKTLVNFLFYKCCIFDALVSDFKIYRGKQDFAPRKVLNLSLIHIWRCRRYAVCRSRWSPYH